MSMNSPLTWLRGGIGDQGIQSVNFQRFGVSPYMQPRLDSSMLGLQPDIYHAMTANSLHEPLSLDPSKVPNQLLMQLQQNLPNASASSIQNQILQQSNSQPNFVQNFQENVVSQAQILQQQLELQQQFKEQQSQQLQQHDQRAQQSQQMHQHFQDQQNKTLIQNGPHLTPMQSMASTSQLHNFSDLIGNHVPSSNTSSMPQSLLTSFSNEGSLMVNWHGPQNTSISHSSSSKRVALDPQLPPKVSQFGLLHPDELGQKIPDLSALLPPFPGREFLGLQGATDSHNKMPFGVATDSSSAMMLNGLSSSFRNSGNENGSLSMPYGTQAFASAAGAEFPRNSELTSSSCVDESGYLHASENADHTNPPPGTFVKVSVNVFLDCYLNMVFILLRKFWYLLFLIWQVGICFYIDLFVKF